MANEEHLKILKEGVEVWNRWREENPNIRPDLEEAYLREADVSRADLRGADLEAADLIEAKLMEENRRLHSPVEYGNVIGFIYL